MKLIAGRHFNAEGTGDYEKSMIINEKLAFQFGWKPEDAIGQQVRNSDTSVCTVVGVMKDFTQNTLFDPIQPVAMVLTSPDKLLFAHNPDPSMQCLTELKNHGQNSIL